MTKYEEMSAVAKQASENWIRRNDSATRVLTHFLTGFKEYCQIPNGQLKLMPWIEAEQVYSLRPGEIFGVPQAMRHDESADEWSIGVHLRLNPSTNFSPLTIQFGLFVSENAGMYQFRVGQLTVLPPVDADNGTHWTALFEAMVDEIKNAFRGGVGAGLSNVESTKRYGFQFNV
jgi:hypothetical protein